MKQEYLDGNIPLHMPLRRAGTSIQIRLEKKLANEFDYVCKQLKVSKSTVVRDLMKNFITKYYEMESKRRDQDGTN